MQYKKSGKICYQSNFIVKANEIQNEKVKGPFDTCGNCSYASHGFICYQNNGSCLRNYLKKKGDK